VGHVESRFSVCLEIVLVSVQYMCMVCPECTPRYEAQVEACLSPFGDSANLNAR
jgi:hypothetical protein